MLHNHFINRAISLLLVFCLNITLLPFAVFADGTDDMYPLGASGDIATPGSTTSPSGVIIIAAFETLPEEILYQGYDAGTITIDDLYLPDTLAALDEDNSPIEITGVTWTSNPSFDPDVSIAYPGYTFAPVLPEGCRLSEGVALPIITVFIRPEGGVGIVPLAATQANSFMALQAAITNAPADGTETVIEITAGIQFNGELTIAAGQNIKIWSAAPYTLKATSNRRLFTVKGNLTLKDDIALEGTGKVSDGGGVFINGGSFTMEGGNIRGCQVINGGAGVRVANKGTFTMLGGKISGNTASANYFGGGVFVDGIATFIMRGGEITGNYASSGGGVHVYNRGTFTMYGGKITGNTANMGGGLEVYDGSVFTMEGGEISGNSTDWGSAGGIYVDSNSSVTMKGGIISGNSTDYDGGGMLITDNSTFTMNGGKIIGNSAASGGGVYVYDGTVTINGGIISGNSAKELSDNNPIRGGGVFIGGYGTFIMNSGTISDNTAEEDGGGVCMRDDDARFVMNGGTISGNISKYCGGGVFIDEGMFTMNSGAISNNSTTQGHLGNQFSNLFGGGGVYVSNGTFTMEGGEINDNISCDNGGGVTSSNRGTFIMRGGEISRNTISEDIYNSYISLGIANIYDLHTAGGICIDIFSSASIVGGVIRDNTTFYGAGGIMTDDTTSYANLYVGPDVIFSGNVTTLSPLLIYDGFPDITNRIETTSSSYPGLHPLNGHDIYYRGGYAAVYTVTFRDWNGTMLNFQEVGHGQTATAPSVPEREGYTFIGWDNDFSNITGDLTVTAQYSLNSPTAYTVTFKDWNGDTLKTEAVNYGQTANAPTTPTRAGYDFTGWDKPFNNITGDLTITAQYKLKSNVIIIDKSGDYDLSNNSFTGDYLITANNVNVYSMYLNGNLYIEANNVNIHDGTINGNVVITGNTVKIESFYISGNVSIKATDTTIKDTTMGGDLTIEKTVADGNVTLEGVNAKNTTIYVKGGGSNSIKLIDSQIGAVQIDKPVTAGQQPVRVVASGSTTVKSTTVLSPAIVQNQNLGTNSTGLGAVTLSSAIPQGSKISLSGDFDNVILEASNISVEVLSGQIKTLSVASSATNTDITGKGRIVNAQVNNVKGSVNFKITPQSVVYTEAPAASSSTGSRSSNKGVANPAQTVPASRTSGNVNADGSVSSGKLADEFNQAITTSGGLDIKLKAVNAKTVSASTLKALAAQAKKAGKTVILHADTVGDTGNVQTRLYIEPTKLTHIDKEIRLEIFTEEGAVASKKSLFEKWFRNKVTVISCAQQDSFGAELEIAAKLDLSGDVKDLIFYSYNAETNKLTKFTAKYTIDSTGYIHFKTYFAGDIIISNGVLVKK